MDQEEGTRPEYGQHDKGPWTVSPDGSVIESDDFTHDVQIQIYGDFFDSAQKKMYADNIAKKLNA